MMSLRLTEAAQATHTSQSGVAGCHFPLPTQLSRMNSLVFN